jgi:hypothetical protein
LNESPIRGVLTFDMVTCPQIESLLPLFAGDDLPERDATLVRGHLAGCVSCRSSSLQYIGSISLIKNELASDSSLPELVRRRVVMDAVRNQRGFGIWQALRARLASVHAGPGLLAASTALVLALVAIPVARQHHATDQPGESTMALEVVADAQGVRLAWSNGSRDAYTVYKSDDPREFPAAEAHVVRGNVWVDEGVESAPIVYYKIE